MKYTKESRPTITVKELIDRLQGQLEAGLPEDTQVVVCNSTAGISELLYISSGESKEDGWEMLLEGDC